MKITVEFDVKIDGNLDEKKVKDVFIELFEPKSSVILSENHEKYESEDWALLINGWEIK